MTMHHTQPELTCVFQFLLSWPNFPDIPGDTLSKGDEHPTNALDGVWSSLPFTLRLNCWEFFSETLYGQLQASQ